MSHIGEKYFFVSPNQLRDGDRIRTLLGRFWYSFRGIRYGYGDDPRQKRATFRMIKNYWRRQRANERSAIRQVSPRARFQIRNEYRAMLQDKPLPKNRGYILPNKWVSIKQAFSREISPEGADSKLLKKYEDNATAEVVKVTYQEDSLRYAPTVMGHSIYKKHLRRRSWMRRAVDAIVSRTLRSITVRGTSHDDFAVELERPIHRSITEQMNAGTSNIRIATSEQNCQYNYFLENFERRMLAAPDINETELPNAYVVNMVGDNPSMAENVKQGRWSSADDDTYAVASLWDEIPQEAISFRVARNDKDALKSPRKLGKTKKKRGSTNSNSAYVEYLELYTKAFPKLTQGQRAEAQRKNSNILFSAKNYNFLQDVTSKSENIPACLSVEFSTPRSSHGSLVSLLGESNMSTIFMLKALETNMPPNQVNRRARNLWTDENPRFYSQNYFLNEKGKVHLKNNTSPEKISLPSYDVTRFLKSLLEESPGRDGLDANTEEISTVIDDGTELSTFQPIKRASEGMDNSAGLLKTRMSAFILLGQLQKMMEIHKRSYMDILDGKKPYSEIIFYEIEKIKISTNGVREIIQRFYLPNFAGRETLGLLDAQVKYDGVYQYNVHAWTMVLGNTYRYVGYSVMQETKENLRNGFQVGVVNVPSAKMMRLPYYSFEPIRVRDFPPIAPNVDIVPLRAVNDRLILNFTPSIDNYMVKPIHIEAADFSKFDNCYQSQYGKAAARRLATLLAEDEGSDLIPLRYKSDDLPRFFEVFRIEGYKPRTWRDFENNKIAVLNAEEDETSMLDNIDPNTDYYYTFRSVDIHGNVSNPSDILRVKLVDDQGIFPIIEPYDLDKDSRLDRNFVKSFKKYLQITPVFEQILYKDDRQEDLKKSIADQRKIRLGTAQDSIYGKVLKFRLTSKKSGRKVDLNVSFKHDHKKPARD